VLITAQQVSHSFAGQETLLREVSFVVGGGQTLAVTGPSGCGKSTLLAIVAGWLTPRSGSVDRDEVRRLTWVPQNPYGVPKRSAIDHVLLPMLARGEPRKAAKPLGMATLARFGIDELADRPFGHLSGGEAQRLMLARAVASRADLILVDEPTAQLDPSAAAAVVGVLNGLAVEGAAVIIATHDPRVVGVCSDVLSLSRP
jgi:putative ABC transport system ATP-binding protein